MNATTLSIPSVILRILNATYKSYRPVNCERTPRIESRYTSACLRVYIPRPVRLILYYNLSGPARALSRDCVCVCVCVEQVVQQIDPVVLEP